MADVRDVDEFFFGPSDNPQPDRFGRGKIAEFLRQAQVEEIDELTWEVRTTDAGTNSSEQVWHGFVKATDDPEVFVNRLLQGIAERLPASYSGQLRINFRTRAGGAHHGSYSRQIRAVPSSITRSDVGGATSVLVVREPDAIRPWVDMLMRFAGVVERLGLSSAELLKAHHPPVANTAGGALMQALTAATAVGAAANGAAPAAAGGVPGQLPQHSGTLRPYEPPPRPTWPFEEPVQPQAEQRQLDGPRPLTSAEVEAWCRANPDETRAMIGRAMAAGATL